MNWKNLGNWLTVMFMIMFSQPVSGQEDNTLTLGQSDLMTLYGNYGSLSGLSYSDMSFVHAYSFQDSLLRYDDVHKFISPDMSLSGSFRPLSGYTGGGVLFQSNGFSVFGSSSGSSLVGLMDRRSATLGMSRSFGRLTAVGFMEANKYHVPFATRDQFGVGGQMTYRFSDALSMTVFGQYYNTNPYFSMAAFPEVNTTSFGGYFSIDGKRAGIDLGVERHYDPFSRSFVTLPIVTPKYKFSDNFKIEVPVGGLLQHCFENMFKINRQSDPNIMPGMIR